MDYKVQNSKKKTQINMQEIPPCPKEDFFFYEFDKLKNFEFYNKKNNCSNILKILKKMMG